MNPILRKIIDPEIKVHEAMQSSDFNGVESIQSMTRFALLFYIYKEMCKEN